MVATGQVSNVRESHTVTVMKGIKWQQRDSYSAIIRPAECKLFSNNQEARNKQDSSVITRAWCCSRPHTHTQRSHQIRPDTNIIYHLFIPIVTLSLCVCLRGKEGERHIDYTVFILRIRQRKTNTHLIMCL